MAHPLYQLEIGLRDFLAEHGAKHDPADSTTAAFLFSGLAKQLGDKFHNDEDAAALKKGLFAAQQAVELTPDDYPSKAEYLHQFSNMLRDCFLVEGELAHLAQAISSSWKAAEATADDDTEKAARLDDLAILLYTRFTRAGDFEDLVRAISVGRRAVELTPDGHPSKALFLNHLGLNLRIHFQRVRDIEYIDQAIHAHQQAADLTPDDNPEKAGRLTNLSTSLSSRFARSRNPEDSARAVQAITRAVELTPDKHRQRASRLTNMCNVLHLHGKSIGSIEALTQAIDAGQQAIKLDPDGHRDKSRWFGSLSQSYYARYRLSNNPYDLEQAISASQKSIEFTPDGHPDKAMYLNFLGNILRARFRRTRDLDDFACAVRSFQDAYNSSSSMPRLRFSAARRWGDSYVARRDNLAALPAYEKMLSLIPLIVTLERQIERRFDDVAREIGDAIGQAVTTAISSGKPDLALEWLEAGRGIVWDQLYRLRTPLDNLRLAHPKLAEDFERVSLALQAPTEPVQANALQDTPNSSSDKDDALHRLHVSRQFASLVTEIRAQEGFQDFLQRRTLPQLANALSNLPGPVIVIHAHASRCDALILSPHGHFRHVPLKNFSMKLAEQLRSHLKGAFSGGRAPRDQLSQTSTYRHRGEVPFQRGSAFRKVLSCLWRFVVQPILEAIEDMLWEATTDKKPPVVWCPTGPLVFLPLHAAGVYAEGHLISTSNFVVSSYTPSISALLRASSRSAEETNTPVSLLCVSQVHSPIRPDLSPLYGVVEEIDLLKGHFADAFTSLDEERATVAEVLSAARRHTWIHLACHGIQHSNNPTQSAFLLHDDLLTLSKLIIESAPGAELAFLSACETAAGDNRMPDEAVHLAAGMLAVGYRAVVGTMWSIVDKDAPVVVDAFYSNLLKLRKSECAVGGQTGKAYALDEAVQKLRDTVGVDSFSRWIPFVHFGL